MFGDEMVYLSARGRWMVPRYKYSGLCYPPRGASDYTVFYTLYCRVSHPRHRQEPLVQVRPLASRRVVRRDADSDMDGVSLVSEEA